MTFSYTQISQYLRCPRSYRYRYLDGWREKESRASLCFGRCFEKALAAFFEREDAGAVLFKEWGTYRDVPLEYSHGDDWERLLRQGIALLEQFARDNRIRIRQPKRNMQKKIVRSLSDGNEFVAYSNGDFGKGQGDCADDQYARNERSQHVIEVKLLIHAVLAGKVPAKDRNSTAEAQPILNQCLGWILPAMKKGEDMPKWHAPPSVVQLLAGLTPQVVGDISLAMHPCQQFTR